MEILAPSGGAVGFSAWIGLVSNCRYGRLFYGQSMGGVKLLRKP